MRRNLDVFARAIRNSEGEKFKRKEIGPNWKEKKRVRPHMVLPHLREKSNTCIMWEQRTV